MTKRLDLDMDQLKRLYFDEEKTPAEVGAIMGCSQWSVTRYLRRYGL